MTMRNPAVAGLFYHDDPGQLRLYLEETIGSLGEVSADPAIMGLIVPHAGYVYSGATAAKGYLTLAPERFSRVLLLGPNHRVPLSGIAASPASHFITPLGEIALEQECIGQLRSRSLVIEHEGAHRLEHCLEVQLPFLQYLLNEFTLIPLVVGECSPSGFARS